jgi:ribonuclease BN (tRNA processing enzyme)
VEDVVFLGTGAAAPFKYRTVSSIYLRLSYAASAVDAREADGGGGGGHAVGALEGGVLLDAGDGTYGAMVRKMGADAADAAVMGLKLLFISHKHADHMPGAAGILTRRGALLRARRQAPAATAAAVAERAAGPTCLSGGDVAKRGGGAAVEVCECSVCGQRFASEQAVKLHQVAGVCAASSRACLP